MRTPNNRFLGALLLAGLVSLAGCGGKKAPTAQAPASGDYGEMVEKLDIPPSFDFATTQEVQLRLEAQDGSARGVAYVRLNVFNGDPTEGGALVLSGATDLQGVMETRLSLPARLEQIYVQPDYLGLGSGAAVPIVDGKAEHLFGGPLPPGGGEGAGKVTATSGTLAGYLTLGTWNSAGVPNYLERQNDVISSSLLNNINASLPEGRPVPTYHAEYLVQGRSNNLRLAAAATVWITFVHEGAGWTNSLGFYTHPLNSPPATAAAIANPTIIFPNVSYQGSGGGLRSGNKVKLGDFPANTEIGWFLVAQGWSGGTVQNRTYTVYSNPALNPESEARLKQHNVLLNDAENNLVLMGFEDIRRDQSSCDNDFNDAVFYVTATPYSAVIVDDMAPIDTPADRDGDTISDTYDDYPDDPARAFNTYYPALNQFGTLAFEDRWPAKGDYDFNDLVVDYQFNQVVNAQNRLVDIIGDLKVRAAGAAYNNGFGFQLPYSPAQISSVAGAQLKKTYVQTDARKLETGQSKAVVVVFDGLHDLMARPNNFYINTQPEAPYVAPLALHLTINLASPVSIAQAPPFNPFLIVAGQRGQEVHLSGQSPTDKADVSIFNSQDDRSTTAGYYKTSRYLPWAINLAESWTYPVEGATIVQAYPSFGTWAESGGSLAKDWYTQSGGNPVASQLYQR